jgi:hypothetical protein
MDSTWAASYLMSLGIGHWADYFQRFGGYLLGLRFAEVYLGTSIPPDIRLTREEAVRFESSGRWVDQLGGGFVVKYSGHRESFSPFSRRGGQSSRNRFWDDNHKDGAVDFIRTATLAAPEATKFIVLQSYVRPSNTTGVIHVHAYKNRAVAEVSGNGYRLLAIFESGVVETHIIYVPHVRSTGDLVPNLPRLLKRAVEFRNVLGFDLDIECFQRSDDLIITQLRPIPEEINREEAMRASMLVRQALVTEASHVSPWVFGTWTSTEAYCINEQAPNRPAVLMKRYPDIRQCDDILERISHQLPTLALDPFDGFRITHYPSLLPENMRLRKYFSYVSMAEMDSAILDKIGMISVVCDGDLAIIRY